MLYVNIEAAQAARERVEAGMAAVVQVIAERTANAETTSPLGRRIQVERA